MENHELEAKAAENKLCDVDLDDAIREKELKADEEKRSERQLESEPESRVERHNEEWVTLCSVRVHIMLLSAYVVIICLALFPAIAQNPAIFAASVAAAAGQDYLDTERSVFTASY